MLRRTRMLATGWAARARYFIPPPLPPDFEPANTRIIKRVRRHTLTGPHRLNTLVDATRYAARREGAFVECGVWRGGSMMAVALTLLELGVSDRDLYLFDTFTGMTEPTAEDEDSAYDGYSLHRRFRRKENWIGIPRAEVEAAMRATGYPAARIHLVEGRVEETLPDEAPDRIALLRLDTDWYASTRHELEHLYPRVAGGGVVILDDYGHYGGARRAVDEYFGDDAPLLQRIDYTGRLAIKPG